MPDPVQGKTRDAWARLREAVSEAERMAGKPMDVFWLDPVTGEIGFGCDVHPRPEGPGIYGSVDELIDALAG